MEASQSEKLVEGAAWQFWQRWDANSTPELAKKANA